MSSQSIYLSPGKETTGWIISCRFCRLITRKLGSCAPWMFTSESDKIPSMRVLITGITGFVGSHLADYILANFPEVEVHGLKRWRSDASNVRHIENRLKFHECDIKDAHNLYEVIGRIQPDKIFHLAAQSYVPASWESPAETLQTNIIG